MQTCQQASKFYNLDNENILFRAKLDSNIDKIVPKAYEREKIIAENHNTLLETQPKNE